MNQEDFNVIIGLVKAVFAIISMIMLASAVFLCLCGIVFDRVWAAKAGGVLFTLAAVTLLAICIVSALSGNSVYLLIPGLGSLVLAGVIVKFASEED